MFGISIDFADASSHAETVDGSRAAGSGLIGSPVAGLKISRVYKRIPKKFAPNQTNRRIGPLNQDIRPTSSRRRLNNLDDVQFPLRVKNCAVELAQNGVGALAELFDLTAPRAVRYARALTHNSHDAEDAIQAAMVRVALHPRVLGEAWHPWAYFLRIVRNESLKIIQRKRDDRLVPQIAEAWSEDVPDENDSRHYVRQALQKLPATQAEVVVLKIWEGMTFAEIGEVLGESPNTAASRYRYALQKLSLYLQPLADEVSHEQRSYAT